MGRRALIGPRTPNALYRSSLVSANCVYEKCLKLDMLKGETRALAVHWPLARAGLAPDELYLRYYLKLGPTFNVYSGDATGKVVGQGGKLPGLADVRGTSDPAGSAGMVRDGRRDQLLVNARRIHPLLSGVQHEAGGVDALRVVSVLLPAGGGRRSSTGHNGNWDSNPFGGFSRKGGTCQRVPNNTICPELATVVSS